MTLDDQLGVLLTEAADDALPATRVGVQSAIDRRRRRRTRQRIGISGIAAICLAAGIAGGLALSGDDDHAPIVDEPPPPAGRPLVGVDLPGWELLLAGDSTTSGPGSSPSRSDEPFVAFTEENPLVGPVVVLAVDTSGADLDPGGTPVDFDGDGSTGGAADGRVSTDEAGFTLVTFTVPGAAALAGVSGFGTDDEDLLAYAATLATGPTFGLEDAPPPTGLDRRQLVDVDPEAQLALTSYRGPDGEELTLVTRDDPASAILATINRGDRGTAEELELGDSFLGPGRAVVYDEEPASGVVLTDTGLTVELTAHDLDANSVDADTIRQIITEGRFVEVPPSVPETPTTVVASATTYVPSTTVSEESASATESDSAEGGSGTGPGRLVGLGVGPQSEGDRVTLNFEGGIPEYEVTSSDEPTPPGEGSCPDDLGDPGASYLRVRLTLPNTGDPANPPAPVPGYGVLNSTPDGVVQGAYVPCSWFEGVVWVDISLNHPASDFRTQELHDPDRLVIDVEP